MQQGTQRWEYDEFEQGEAVLGRLKWLEKGREGLLEELSQELDGLEGGTIQQVTERARGKAGGGGALTYRIDDSQRRWC